MDSYGFFARYYDGLMTDAQYSERCAYILELLKRHNHDPGITLDLACGTGALTRELYKCGVDVYGVDASEEMLTEAVQKNCEEGINILYLCQKMQELDLYGTIDTCVCTLDSINHLTEVEDVAAAFDRVGLFMNKDGLFVFDVNTVYKHREVLADNAFVFENETHDLFGVEFENIAIDFRGRFYDVSVPTPMNPKSVFANGSIAVGILETGEGEV